MQAFNVVLQFLLAVAFAFANGNHRIKNPRPIVCPLADEKDNKSGKGLIAQLTGKSVSIYDQQRCQLVSSVSVQCNKERGQESSECRWQDHIYHGGVLAALTSQELCRFRVRTSPASIESLGCQKFPVGTPIQMGLVRQKGRRPIAWVLSQSAEQIGGISYVNLDDPATDAPMKSSEIPLVPRGFVQFVLPLFVTAGSKGLLIYDNGLRLTTVQLKRWRKIADQNATAVGCSGEIFSAVSSLTRDSIFLSCKGASSCSVIEIKYLHGRWKKVKEISYCGDLSMSQVFQRQEHMIIGEKGSPPIKLHLLEIAANKVQNYGEFISELVVENSGKFIQAASSTLIVLTGTNITSTVLAIAEVKPGIQKLRFIENVPEARDGHYHFSHLYGDNFAVVAGGSSTCVVNGITGVVYKCNNSTNQRFEILTPKNKFLKIEKPQNFDPPRVETSPMNMIVSDANISENGSGSSSESTKNDQKTKVTIKMQVPVENCSVDVKDYILNGFLQFTEITKVYWICLNKSVYSEMQGTVSGTKKEIFAEIQRWAGENGFNFSFDVKSEDAVATVIKPVDAGLQTKFSLPVDPVQSIDQPAYEEAKTIAKAGFPINENKTPADLVSDEKATSRGYLVVPLLSSCFFTLLSCASWWWLWKH